MKMSQMVDDTMVMECFTKNLGSSPRLKKPE